MYFKSPHCKIQQHKTNNLKIDMIMWVDLWNIPAHYFPVIKTYCLRPLLWYLLWEQNVGSFPTGQWPLWLVYGWQQWGVQVSMHTHCASSCYPKQRHLWDFSERWSHTFAKSQSQWKTGVLCLNTLTVLQKDSRRDRHLWPRAWVVTHLQYYSYMWTHKAEGR